MSNPRLPKTILIFLLLIVLPGAMFSILKAAEKADECIAQHSNQAAHKEHLKCE